MYQIQPYDLSQSFKNIPEKKKYSFNFYRNSTIDFKSKREAFKFISHVSQLFAETLAICEMVNNTIHTFSFHIKANSKSNHDSYNIYNKNYHDILTYIRDIKLFQIHPVNLQQFVKKFDLLIDLISQNCDILNRRNKNCVVAYQIVLNRSSNSMWVVIDNIHKHYSNNSLTLFLK